uniref:Uncharacterized protein AlNc14C106G6238 n=1 Tax=Albugo laibachii Nc14 TaxID=890382 RepID=F0WI31_9STRA|nr:conserved hypothetical protein [Albugo laibachii Nc14]|eukprot:CCA20909.1 conserved hypothetical protein [Albugo laibachii Nc14]
MSDSKFALSYILNAKQVASPSRSRHNPCANSISPRAQADKCVKSTGLTALSEAVSTATYKRNLPISKSSKPEEPSRCCRMTGCENLIVSRSLCVKHGGGTRCTFPECTKRAKLNRRCFQHGGCRFCKVDGCKSKAKRHGCCWSHGGGMICQVKECTKISTQGGLCWAHGGGSRCRAKNCQRRSYQKLDYYCTLHADTISHEKREALIG